MRDWLQGTSDYEDADLMGFYDGAPAHNMGSTAAGDPLTRALEQPAPGVPAQRKVCMLAKEHSSRCVVIMVQCDDGHHGQNAWCCHRVSAVRAVQARCPVTVQSECACTEAVQAQRPEQAAQGKYACATAARTVCARAAQGEHAREARACTCCPRTARSWHMHALEQSRLDVQQQRRVSMRAVKQPADDVPNPGLGHSLFVNVKER
eukprot:1147853-Pelagomonas_calceolata.AAC.3